MNKLIVNSVLLFLSPVCMSSVDNVMIHNHALLEGTWHRSLAYTLEAKSDKNTFALQSFSMNINGSKRETPAVLFSSDQEIYLNAIRITLRAASYSVLQESEVAPERVEVDIPYGKSVACDDGQYDYFRHVITYSLKNEKVSYSKSEPCVR